MARTPTDNIDTGTAPPRSGGENWSRKQPPNTATNLHKNMATGTSLSEGEGKALTSAQVERKER
jgi:hypothetical protein